MHLKPSVPVLMSADEIAFADQRFNKIMRRVLRQPLPAGFAPRPLPLDGGPFGAFERSRALTDDGRIVAVATPATRPVTSRSSASMTTAAT